MRHLITSALPYINGIKHLGNLVGSMLPADVFARYLRLEGHEVLYICATDEHGAPAELAAADAKVPVAQFCADMHRVQGDIYARFGIAFDHFGRSSSRENAALTQTIAKELSERGFIETRTINQLYSPVDGRFLPDRYVVGTCPHCGYAAARGDQCENCTRLLDPTELLDARSAISGSRDLEVRATKHLFLKLPALEGFVREWVTTQQERWPALTRSIAQKWLGEGLRDRCITRDLRWGVPVPLPDFEGKVFYVWFDAPIEYIGATQEWAAARGRPDAWRDWWRASDEVRYTQFMGKDNLPFHTIMFPAMLLGTGEPRKMADQIKGFHWLDYYGGKFSTSAKRGIFTDTALELFPGDYWRYALLTMIPETADSTFTWELFAQAVNKDLSGTFGNFVNRVLRFAASKFGDTIPEGGTPGPREAGLAEQCADQVNAYREAMGNLEFREAIRGLKALWTIGNVYIDEAAPWKAIKADRDAAAMTIRTCINLIRLCAAASLPVIPGMAGTVLDALGLSPEERALPLEKQLDLTLLPAGRSFSVPPLLVTPIEEEQVAQLKERFGN